MPHTAMRIPLDFVLPRELEAVAPAEPRDGVRLLVTEQGRTRHAAFRDLAQILEPGDLLVANDSATLPAALPLEGGGVLHLSTPLPSGRFDLRGTRWIVEPRGTRGHDLALPGGARARLLSPHRGRRLWEADLDIPGQDLPAWLSRHGSPIRYPYVSEPWPLAAYQTVFARVPGSAEMPSAGRPFTEAMLARLRARGVAIATLTLHTGVASAERDEAPYAEWLEVPATTREALARARRVIAVGTTVVRALESDMDEGWTDLVITPDRPMRKIDGMITGLHEPRASHLQMLLSLCPQAGLARAYEEALRGRYLWHEFGDLHLIVSPRAPGR